MPALSGNRVRSLLLRLSLIPIACQAAMPVHADTWFNFNPFPMPSFQMVDTPRQIADIALHEGSMVLNGAHSRPLSFRTAPGQDIYWITGDWGNDSHGYLDGHAGLAELGIGRNFGRAQVNLAMGRNKAQQQHALNGKQDHVGTHLMAETLLPIEGGPVGIISAYYQWGNADIRRSYLTAGMPDFSSGSTDTRTWGLRARLEWDRALKLGSFEFSPYLDLSYLHSRIQAYTETGGTSPNWLDAHKDKATELRLGLNASKPLSASTSLLLQLEAAHRFEAESRATSGGASGLFGYAIISQPYEQDWLRAALGIESALAGGKATLMFNLASEGNVANAWLTARFQRAF